MTETNLDLFTKESRRQWEQQFYKVYIQPVLNDMDSRLNKAQNSFMNDNRQGIYFHLCLHMFVCFFFISAHNALLQVVYEKNEEKSPTAAMWRYRSRITIEHLEFFIEQQKSTEKWPILKKYLKEVHNQYYKNDTVTNFCSLYICRR